MMVELERILQFLEDTFEYSTFPDYPNSLNGLQVAGADRVARIATAVDASEASIRAAVEWGADFLLVHHGLFWDGFGPLTGPMFRKVRALIDGGVALFSLHLPLDAHRDLGNAALLARALGMEPGAPFGEFQGREVGWAGSLKATRDEIAANLGKVVGGPVRIVPGGPETVARVGVLTGAGASSLPEAAGRGLDALVTGEAAHHHFHAAMELGVNLFLAGHYATETFGVRTVGGRLSEEFGLPWRFLDFPTGF